MAFASPRVVQWEYRVQRAGFACFSAVALAAAFGVLGDRARVVASATVIYLLLLVIFRIAGRRTLAETTSFDLVLLLIIGETTQQAMIGQDETLTTAAVAIVSLVSLDMSVNYLKRIFPAFDHLMEGRPVRLIHEGQVDRHLLNANGIDEEDIKEAARLSHGLDSMEDVRQATLERGGHISIVPWRGERP